MKNGIVNADKVIGIANRLRLAPKTERAKVLEELVAAIDEDGAEAPPRRPSDAELSPSNFVKLRDMLMANPKVFDSMKDDQIDPETLRDMLSQPEIKNDPLATALIARTIIASR